VIGYLGLGSNVGDRRASLQAAADALPAQGVGVLASSSVYETEPVGEVLDQSDFLNACLRIDTGAEGLLDACKAVERELGREPGGPRHGPRPIDVDLLLFGDAAYSSERLTLPHPEVTARRFVLVPLLELDPDLTLPDGFPLQHALKALPPGQEVRRRGPPLDVASDRLRTFRARYEATHEAFNRHDFEAAFARTPEDVEWRTIQEIPGVPDVMRGRDEVIAFFRETLNEWPDWHTELEGFEEPAAGVILVAFVAHGTGRVSGASLSNRVVQAWDFRSRPLRVTEYLGRDEALADLGVEGSDPGGARPGGPGTEGSDP
jgi:2-amino-4-hydroxy-6-hydroxymethyldihydropteridine diphosphokinase